MTKNKMLGRTKRFAMLALLAGAAGRADASIIFTIDHTGGNIPILSQSGTTIAAFTILPDSTIDFLHFNLLYMPNPGVTTTWSMDFLNNDTGELSDRFLITLPPLPPSTNNILDVQFDSRATILISKGVIDQGSYLETAAPQNAFSAQWQSSDTLQILVKSEAGTESPEPGSLAMGAAGMLLAAIVRSGRWRP